MEARIPLPSMLEARIILLKPRKDRLNVTVIAQSPLLMWM